MTYGEHALVIHVGLHVAYVGVWSVLVMVCGQVALVWLMLSCIRSWSVLAMVMHL